MKQMKIYSLITAIFIITVLVSGCSLGKTSSKAENTNTESVDEDSSIDLLDSLEVVNEDVFGEDLNDVPRYEGSIRSYYSQDDEETSVTYQTKDQESKVRDFYKKTLEAKGWKQTGTATDYVDFEKGNSDNPEVLTIYFTYYEDEKILEYELVYSPPLTDAELKAEAEISEE